MSKFDLNSYKILKESPRYVTISGDINNIGNEGNISICANGNLLRRGDEVLLHGIPMIIKNIECDENRKTAFHIYFYNLNKTSRFIIPFYFKNKLELKWDKYFCNAYIKYKDKSNIFILFKYNLSNEMSSSDIEYLNFEKKLCKHKNFINNYDLKGYTLFEFDIPKAHKSTIELLIAGKYSEIPSSDKDIIINFYNANEKSIVGGTLNKTTFRKKEVENLFGISLDDDSEYLGEFLMDEPEDITNEIKSKMIMYKEILC